MKPVNVNASGALRHVTLTVRVRGMARLRARMWLGGWLLHAAAWVMGCRIEVEAE